MTPRIRTPQSAPAPLPAERGKSLRRSVQLLAERPDLVIVPLRGNVPTRLKRAGDGLDAVVVALAGVRRLGLEQHVTEVLPPELSLPAAGQGAMAIETLSGSRGEAAALPLDDPHTARCVRAERAVLARVVRGCTPPGAALPLEGRARANLSLPAPPGGTHGRGGGSLARA